MESLIGEEEIEVTQVVPALFFIDHDGRGPIVFKCNHCNNRRVGLFYTLGATIRHDDMTRVAQGQNPSVAQIAFHRDNSAHSPVSVRLGRSQDQNLQVRFGHTGHTIDAWRPSITAPPLKLHFPCF